MLHVIRYASAGMLLLVFGVNSLYMYKYRYRYTSRDRHGQRHIVVVGARRIKINTADTDMESDMPRRIRRQIPIPMQLFGVNWLPAAAGG